MFLFLFFIFRIFKIAKISSDDFVRFFAVGLGVWFGGQAVINVGAMVGLLPLTGVPLPFVSYGGTSLMIIMTACGILINMVSTKHGNTREIKH